MTDAEIERIEALMREATPGPWHARRNDQDDGRTHYDVDDSDEREVACVRHALPHNARLIVAAINALPALLAERKELLRRVEEAEAKWQQAEFDLKKERQWRSEERDLLSESIGAVNTLRTKLAEAQHDLGVYNGLRENAEAERDATRYEWQALRAQLAKAQSKVANAYGCGTVEVYAKDRASIDAVAEWHHKATQIEEWRVLLTEAQSAQARAVAEAWEAGRNAAAATPAPHPYLRIDDYRCATCGRLKAVCEAEWAAHQDGSSEP
jgi:hypothetical protein